MKIKQKRRAISQIEYGILAALIAIASIAAIKLLGTNINNQWCTISNHINNGTTMTATGCKNTGGYGTGATYGVSTSDGAACYGPEQPTPCTIMDAQLLYQINQKDPVTGIYGLANNNIPVTNYNDAINTLQKGVERSYGVTNSANNENFQYEIKTKDGSTYGVYYGNNGYGVRNLNNNETYTFDINGVLQNIGITNNNGGDK